MEEQLRIEGTPEDLEAIRKQLLAELGDDLELDEMSSRQAVLHRERMRTLELALLCDIPEPVTLADVQSLAR